MPVPGAVTDPSRIRTEEVAYRSGGDTIRAYLARPREPGRYPGLIVVHEAFGLVDHIKDLARRFANLGYLALAPDLYSREGGPDPAHLPSVLEKMFALPDRQVVQDLAAAADQVRALEGAAGTVGCIGFCSGGRQTLLFACSTDRLQAAVDCWGGFITRATPNETTTPTRPTPVLDMIDRLSCPLYAAFGEEDQNPSPAEAALLRDRARQGGKDVTVKVYAGAGHAFLADYRPTYREGPAAELWRDVVAFLERHLRA